MINTKAVCPLYFNVFNNNYGMGGQTCGETMAYQEVSRLGAGINPSAMHAERVDGYNPLAVIDAYKRKRDIINNKEGPVLLEVMTYRVYRTQSVGCVGLPQQRRDRYVGPKRIRSRRLLKRSKMLALPKHPELEAVEAAVKADILNAVKLAKDDTLSPRMDLNKNPRIIADLMFSNENIKSMEPDRTPDVLEKKEENARVKQIAKKIRSAYDENGQTLFPRTRFISCATRYLKQSLTKYYEDPTLTSYGEDDCVSGVAHMRYTAVCPTACRTIVCLTPRSQKRPSSVQRWVTQCQAAVSLQS